MRILYSIHTEDEEDDSNIGILDIVVYINRNLVKLLVVKDNVWEPNMG